MRRVPSVLAAAALAAALPLAAAGCNTAKPAPQFAARSEVAVPGEPGRVISALRADAAARGWRIVDEGPDSFVADLGVAPRTIPVPTEYGLWGTRVTWRDTEVHACATYQVRRGDKGTTLVSFFSSPTYWHPDIQVWLPGPHDAAPGLEIVTRVAGLQ